MADSRAEMAFRALEVIYGNDPISPFHGTRESFMKRRIIHQLTIHTQPDVDHGPYREDSVGALLTGTFGVGPQSSRSLKIVILRASGQVTAMELDKASVGATI